MVNEDIRYKANQFKAFNQGNSSLWAMSKYSYSGIQDIINGIVDKGGEMLHDNYMHDKLYDYTINGTY